MEHAPARAPLIPYILSHFNSTIPRVQSARISVIVDADYLQEYFSQRRNLRNIWYRAIIRFEWSPVVEGCGRSLRRSRNYSVLLQVVVEKTGGRRPPSIVCTPLDRECKPTRGNLFVQCRARRFVATDASLCDRRDEWARKQPNENPSGGIAKYSAARVCRLVNPILANGYPFYNRVCNARGGRLNHLIRNRHRSLKPGQRVAQHPEIRNRRSPFRGSLRKSFIP